LPSLQLNAVSKRLKKYRKIVNGYFLVFFFKRIT